MIVEGFKRERFGSSFCLTKWERPKGSSGNQNFWERKETTRAIIVTRNREERRPLAELQEAQAKYSLEQWV